MCYELKSSLTRVFGYKLIILIKQIGFLNVETNCVISKKCRHFGCIERCHCFDNFRYGQRWNIPLNNNTPFLLMPSLPLFAFAKHDITARWILMQLAKLPIQRPTVMLCVSWMVCHKAPQLRHLCPQSDCLMQKRRNSSVLAMELRLFCVKPSIYPGLQARTLCWCKVKYYFSTFTCLLLFSDT